MITEYFFSFENLISFRAERIQLSFIRFPFTFCFLLIFFLLLLIVAMTVWEKKKKSKLTLQLSLLCCCSCKVFSFPFQMKSFRILDILRLELKILLWWQWKIKYSSLKAIEKLSHGSNRTFVSSNSTLIINKIQIPSRFIWG